VGIIALVMLGLSFLRIQGPNSFLLVIHYDQAAGESVETAVSRIRNKRLRSKTVTQASAEMTVEIRLPPRQDIVGQMLDIEGVYDATLVACQNEASS
jgi:hypothetical protein